jgi:phosphoadenosine phosphosulfate reductase
MNAFQEQQAAQWSARLAQAPIEQVLNWAHAQFASELVFATSLGAEDQVLTDCIARHTPAIRIFTLDTGRLFPETYDLLRRTERRYAIKIPLYFPDAADVENLVNREGVDCYRQSVDLRRACCHVRKVLPLRRALSGKKAWICGLRRQQAVTRQDMALVEWDADHGLFKINPLAGWSESQVWDYLRLHNVPWHPLHDRGFPSIGCACCTRAVKPGEDLRAGRWWWESPDHKECGLHGH